MTRFDLALAAISVSIFTAFTTLSATAVQEPQGAPDAAVAGTSAAAPLTEDEMEVLVAPIALYPDELVAVITQAALYPLQIVEAERYLERAAKDKSLKPSADWDGSVISLLNYPDVVKMMSQDLDWTQQLGNAITYRQKDVLVAIQQLRDEAVAKEIIKTDDKIKVTTEGDNVVISSANPEIIYVPRYEPEMLYVADYPIEPISYYSEGYPSYWYPTAPYFAAAATGLVWAAAIDWNDWGVWGGRWGNDIDVDCKNCFNNREFNGRVNFNDVDWRNVDRSKIDIDRNQLAKFDQTHVRNSLERDSTNNIRNKTSSIKHQRTAATRDKASGVADVRKSTLEGLKKQQSGPGNAANLKQANAAKAKANANRQGSGKKVAANKAGSGKASANRPNAKKPTNANRSSGKAKPAGRVDNRPKHPSGLGNVGPGKTQKVASSRGAQSMGGGARGGRSMSAGGGGRHMAGGGRGGRGGGGGGRRR
ncbi:DUF3300 domain-containing protein [Mesorhizobium sp. ANAO-SY3R2]|uniref:DUF3300 domain-containing protein n=1 Tax=Mesorhizobium sp. ANAO-SY3R2 TaxID=3166644 RepID=UPI003672E0B1